MDCSFCSTGALCITWLTAPLSRSSTACGVPAGANTPNQVVASKPASPVSAMVGTSGNCGLRMAPVTPSALRSPRWICGMADGRLSNINCTRPASRSIMAGPLPW